MRRPVVGLKFSFEQTWQSVPLMDLWATALSVPNWSSVRTEQVIQIRARLKKISKTLF
jgi:hypothetical protein